jgi:hypothetical protein
MQNGDDIISDITQVGNMVTLTNPMRLIFRRLPTGQVMMLVAPWLPNELIEENYAMVSNADVLTFFSPKNKLVEYYNKMVEINLQRKEDFGKVLDEYLQTEIEDADLEVEETEISSEIMEAIEEFKRNKLH